MRTAPLRGTHFTLARRAVQRGPPTPPGVKEPKLEALPKHTRLILEALRPVPPPPPRSQTERQRLRALMIRYGKLKRLQHLELQIRFNKAELAMWTAIDALPHVRRVEAVHTPAEDFPNDLRVFTHTPPINGFDIAKLTNSPSSSSL